MSATEGFNVEAFESLVARYLPEGPRWFPEDMTSDESDEMLVSEFIREKVLLHTRQEVPHAVGVLCDEIEFEKKLVRIRATIYVERESQKGIIVGKKGAMIKAIGTEARRDLEHLFMERVWLDLTVQVKRDWRRDQEEIRRFGYDSGE